MKNEMITLYPIETIDRSNFDKRLFYEMVYDQTRRTDGVDDRCGQISSGVRVSLGYAMQNAYSWVREANIKNEGLNVLYCLYRAQEWHIVGRALRKTDIKSVAFRDR